jgi:lipopolysaccharide heptosyltransferase I
MSEANTQRFLLVRLSSLGDIVHTVPAFAALRASFPGARIDWVVDERWSQLVEMIVGVDEVIPLNRSPLGVAACVTRLRGAQYSCAVDFQGLYRSAVLMRSAGAARTIGFDRTAAREPGASFFYSERVVPSGRHVAEMNVELAVRAGARTPSVLQFPLRVPEYELQRMREKMSAEGTPDYVVVSPGGGWQSKCWTPERYGALCAELWRRHGLRAMVNVSPSQGELGRSVVSAAGEANPVIVAPPLRELAATLAGARLVIGADTGPVHLAAALGTRVVALFGPTDPARNGPLPRGTVLRNAAAEESTYKRGKTYSETMLSVSVEQVLEAAELEMSLAHSAPH